MFWIHVRLGVVLAVHSNATCQCLTTQGCVLGAVVPCNKMTDVCMGKLSLVQPSETDSLPRQGSVLRNGFADPSRTLC